MPIGSSSVKLVAKELANIAKRQSLMERATLAVVAVREHTPDGVGQPVGVGAGDGEHPDRGRRAAQGGGLGVAHEHGAGRALPGPGRQSELPEVLRRQPAREGDPLRFVQQHHD